MQNKELEEAIKVLNAFINAIDTYGTIDYKCINNLYKPMQTVLTALEEYEKQLDLDYVDKNYIPKHIIEEKIKELQNIRETKSDNYMGYKVESREQQDIDKQIIILQELLEE